MHAVNLIPVDVRVGRGIGAGRSGGAVYVVLGGLTLLVALMGMYFLASTGASDKQTQLAELQTQIQQAQAGADNDATPGIVHAQRTQLTATVRQLAEQRADWGAILQALGRTLPADTTLTGLNAAVDGSTASGGAAPAVAAPGAAPGPVLDLTGCAPSQNAVARLMPTLRGIPDVTGVQLVSSALAESGGSSAQTPCGGAAFHIVLTLTAIAPPAVAAAPGTAATPAATAPATTVPATPATPAVTVPTTATPATATPPSTGAGG
jgi:Tfp pilus assembly protein PilN